MPSKKKIDSAWNKVAQILADRDTKGIIKCCIKTCDVKGDRHVLQLHHRYTPSGCLLKGKGSYAYITDCKRKPENCELVCKRHHDMLTPITEFLWKDLTENKHLVKTIEELKKKYHEMKEELEFKEANPELYEEI